MQLKTALSAILKPESFSYSVHRGFFFFQLFCYSSYTIENDKEVKNKQMFHQHLCRLELSINTGSFCGKQPSTLVTLLLQFCKGENVSYIFRPSLKHLLCSVCACLIWLQFSLLSEMRGVVSAQDLERFDALVLRREIEALKARQGAAGGTAVHTDSFSMVSYPDTLASSSGSYVTSTTLSSARVRGPV